MGSQKGTERHFGESLKLGVCKHKNDCIITVIGHCGSLWVVAGLLQVVVITLINVNHCRLMQIIVGGCNFLLVLENYCVLSLSSKYLFFSEFLKGSHCYLFPISFLF